MKEQEYPDIPIEIQPSKEEWEKSDAAYNVCVLVTNQVNGIPFWAYISVPPSKLLSLKQALNSDQEFAMIDYGTPLKYGVGDVPPQSIVKEMERTYKLNHNFENDVKDLIKDVEKKELATQKEQEKEDLLKKIKTDSNKD